MGQKSSFMASPLKSVFRSWTGKVAKLPRRAQHVFQFELRARAVQEAPAGFRHVVGDEVQIAIRSEVFPERGAEDLQPLNVPAVKEAGNCARRSAGRNGERIHK